MSQMPKANQEASLKIMRERYGTQTNWVSAEIYLTSHEMEEVFGPRCEEYEPLCACCSAWLQWNRTGKATVELERDEVLKLIR